MKVVLLSWFIIMDNDTVRIALQSGLSTNEYEHYFAERTELAKNAANVEINPHLKNLSLNKQRSSRLQKTYIPSADIVHTMEAIESEQLWVIITEDWCGDSAQIVPIVSTIASCSDKVEIRFLLRDTFPDIMNQYLTNGARSIPKVIAFDKTSSEELWEWGPRPEQAAKDFLQRKSEGMPKPENQTLLHTWYAADKGKSTEKEIMEKVLQRETILTI